MTERAMPEGELRTLIAKAAWDAYMGYVTRIPWEQAPAIKRAGYERIADAVLSAIRPHLGLGVTEPHPAIPAIDAWLKAQGDDATELLLNIIEDGIEEENRDAEKWDVYRPERVAYDRRCAEAAGKLRDALFPLIPQPTEEERQESWKIWVEATYADHPRMRDALLAVEQSPPSTEGT